MITPTITQLSDDPTVVQRILDHIDNQTTDLFLHGNAERVFGLT